MSTQLPVEPTVQDRPEVPYVGVARTVTMDDFARIADRIPMLIGWLAERGIAPADAPFLRYRVIDMARGFEVEAGVPVVAPVPGEGEVFASTLPAGRYATTTHVGHPDGLVAATAALLDWGTRQGLRWDMATDADTDTGGERWACRLEVFRSHPAEVPDPNDWVTELAIKATG